MKYMPNLESIAKEMFDKWTDGTFVWEMDKTEKSLWIKLARWHAIEVLKARIEEANEHLYQPNSMADNRIKKLTEQLKSLEVDDGRSNNSRVVYGNADFWSSGNYSILGENR